ncbi:MAG: outer membrane beta-barrel protein [Chitinophagales bacterium]
MHRIILAVLLAVCSGQSLVARDISQKRDLATIFGGVGFVTMNAYKDNAAARNGVKIGGMAGFGYEHRFKKVAAIEINLMYINKGVQQNWKDAATRGYIRSNFHSIEFPILVKFYIGKRKLFNIYAGGYGSYAVNVQIKTKVSSSVTGDVLIDDVKNNALSNDKNPKDINDKRYFRAFDAGVCGGFEFVSKSGFGAGARLDKGLLDFTNPNFVSSVPGIPDNKWITHTSVMFYALFKI